MPQPKSIITPNRPSLVIDRRPRIPAPFSTFFPPAASHSLVDAAGALQSPPTASRQLPQVLPHSPPAWRARPARSAWARPPPTQDGAPAGATPWPAAPRTPRHGTTAPVRPHGPCAPVQYAGAVSLTECRRGQHHRAHAKCREGSHRHRFPHHGAGRPPLYAVHHLVRPQRVPRCKPRVIGHQKATRAASRPAAHHRPMRDHGPANARNCRQHRDAEARAVRSPSSLAPSLICMKAKSRPGSAACALPIRAEPGTPPCMTMHSSAPRRLVSPSFMLPTIGLSGGLIGGGMILFKKTGVDRAGPPPDPPVII